MGKFFKFLSSLLIALLLVLCFALAMLQTPVAKETLAKWIADTAKAEGMEISIGSIDGHIPFKWEVRDIRLKLNATDSVEIDRAKMRISFFPLLTKRFSISYLDLHHVAYRFAEKENSAQTFTPFPLPMHAVLKSLAIQQLDVTNLTQEASNIFAIDGNGYLSKNFSAGALRLHIKTDRTTADLRFTLEQQLSLDVSIDGELSHLLSPFTTLGFESNLDLQATLKGPRAADAPLQGQIFGYINSLEVPFLQAVDQKWKIASSFTVGENHSVHITDLFLESRLLTCKASGKISAAQELESGTFFLNVPKLSRFDADAGIPLKGSLQIHADYSPTEARWDLVTQDIKIGDFSYPNATGTLKAQKIEQEWQGGLTLNANNEELPFEATGTFSALMPHELRIENLQISSQQSSITGQISCNASTPSLEGTLIARIPNLGHFHNAYRGSLGGTATFSGTDHLEMQVTLAHFQYLDMAARSASLNVKLDSIFSSPQGAIDFDAEGVHYHQLDLAKFSFKTHAEEALWPFELHTQGLWKDGLELHTSGAWNYRDQAFDLNLNEFTGFMLKKAFVLNKPCKIAKSKERLPVDICDMKVGLGTFLGSAAISEKSATVNVSGCQVPLEFLMILEPHFSLQGNASFEGALDGRQGHLTLWLEGADIYQFGKTVPLKAKGSIQAHLDRQMLQIHTHLAASDQQFFEAAASLPIDDRGHPLHWKIDEDKPISCEVTMEGKLEEIFDFINIGSHRASGFLSSRLLLSNTLRSPTLKGTMELQAGTYENDYTGTQIREIQGQVVAEGKELKLVSFAGKDPQNGTLSAEGALTFSPKEGFPYTLTAELKELNVLNFDTITSNFTGPMSVSGNTAAAYAKGNLIVSKAEMQIPDELLVDIPVIPITFVHQPAHLKNSTINPLPIFPFHIDLNLEVPGKVEIRGRGLTSQWQGAMHLKGTNVNVAASGNLELVKGEYLFSGKTFKLTQGEISISDKPTQSAYLNLSGTLELPKMTVIAFLRGPLTSPQLTFQSTPALPTSTVLSYILFNKDISEISQGEAIQLAQVLISLSGGTGPDVLEAIRKSIGVDRLNIVSSQNDASKVSVQIGKYLTKGVMVTLSQGINSSQVIVEVELKKGFIFQAETQDEGEGKFTLKWNKNY